MKSVYSSRPRTRLGLAVVQLMISAFLLSNSSRAAEEAKSDKNGSPSKETTAPKKAQKKPPKKLTGADLYALHCNRCHPERYAPERTADQWKTILLHMRTRANLPAEQAKAIMQFLQEDSGK